MSDIFKVSSGGNPFLILLGSIFFAIGLSVIGANALAGTVLILLGILFIFF